MAWIEGAPGVGTSALIGAVLAEAESLGAVVGSVSAGDPRRATFGVGGALGGDGIQPEAAYRMVEGVRAACARSPLVLVLDDLDRAGAEDLATWRLLAGLTESLPLVLLAGCRSVTRRPEVARLRADLLRRSGTVIRLTELDDTAVEAVAMGVWSAPPGPALRAFLDRAAGHPSYLRDGVDILVDEDAVRVAHGVADLSRPPADLCSRLHPLISRRLDFLSPAARAALRAGAAGEDRFTMADLALLSGRPVPRLVDAVDEAMAYGVLAHAGAHLSFRHPVVRAALEQEVPEAERQRRFSGAAKVLAAEGAAAHRVASHLVRCQVLDDWALDWLAGQPHAVVADSTPATVELIGRAGRQVPVEDPRRAIFTARLTTGLRRQHRYEDLVRFGTGCLERVRDPELRGELACNVGYGFYALDEPMPALAILTTMLADPDPDPDPAESAHSESAHSESVLDERHLDEPPLGGRWRGRAQALLALVRSGHGESGESRALAEHAFAEGRRLNDPHTMAWALRCLLSWIPAGTGMSYVEHAVRALAAQDPRAGDLRHGLRTQRLNLLSRLDRTDEFESDLADLRGAATDAYQLANVAIVAARQRLRTGHWDDALAEVRCAGPDGDLELRLVAEGVEAQIAVHRSTRTETLDRLVADSRPTTPGGHLLVHAAALHAEALGDPHAAVKILAELLDERGAGDGEWLPELVRLALAVGDRETAADAASLALARAEIDHRVRVTANICQSMMDGDHALLLQAAQRLERAGRRPEMAFALQEASVRAAERGDRARSRELASRAAAAYVEMGSPLDLKRLKGRLRLLGIRPGLRRRTTTGWEALTPAEQAVVGWIAQGESNAQIAGHLFVSRRTVESHVSHALTKLGARGRADLVRLHGERGVARSAAANRSVTSTAPPCSATEKKARSETDVGMSPDTA